MASKLLGFKGHEKLVDIIATAKVGFPDPMAFALDLTAFFEDNCKKGKNFKKQFPRHSDFT